MPAASTDNILSSALTKVKHRNPELVKRDVLTTLHHYRGLIPKADKFMFNDGAHRDMINIYGTIPVPYKGQNYNIPVSVWILDSHPYHAPICFVKPTAEMQIKVSKHVDQSGQIYLPYLHEWSHPKSDLLGLIQILIVTFSEQPPVYSKPKGQEQPQQQQQPQPTALPYPVYPQNVYQSTGPGLVRFTCISTCQRSEFQIWPVCWLQHWTFLSVFCSRGQQYNSATSKLPTATFLWIHEQ